MGAGRPEVLGHAVGQGDRDVGALGSGVGESAEESAGASIVYLRGGAMRSDRGSAVVVVLTMLAVLTVLVLVNTNTIQQLNRELHRIDEQQTNRWQNEKR